MRYFIFFLARVLTFAHGNTVRVCYFCRILSFWATVWTRLENDKSLVCACVPACMRARVRVCGVQPCMCVRALAHDSSFEILSPLYTKRLGANCGIKEMFNFMIYGCFMRICVRYYDNVLACVCVSKTSIPEKRIINVTRHSPYGDRTRMVALVDTKVKDIMATS